MKKKYTIIISILILIIIICITALGKQNIKNRDLEIQISEITGKYKELRTQKAHDNYVEASLQKISLINEDFKWLKNIKDTEKITFENYSGDIIDIKNETTLNKIILDSLVLENIIIEPDIIIHATLHNDLRFYYTLRYYLRDNVYEILIFDNGTIKYNNLYYESPFLLSAAQSLMPMINSDSIEIQDNAIYIMLNADLATYSEYKISDTDKSYFEQTLGELWINAIRLRTTAYYIKENMIKVNEDIDYTEDMQVLKSTGYSGGKQVDMYIFTKPNGDDSYVKLVYNNNEEVYKLKSKLNNDIKCLPLINIWTAG